MNKVSQSLQEKQPTVFVVNDNMWAFKPKIWILEKSYHRHECDNILILKDFTDDIGNNSECDYCIMKCINTWNISHNSVIQFFFPKQPIHDMDKRSIQSSRQTNGF